MTQPANPNVNKSFYFSISFPLSITLTPEHNPKHSEFSDSLLDNGNNFVSATIENLSNGLVYYYRAVATNFAGISFGNNMLFQTIAASTGDTNGDGIVDSSEFAVVLSHLHDNGVVLSEDLGLVLSNYWSHASAIGMANLTDICTPVVTFNLTNYF